MKEVLCIITKEVSYDLKSSKNCIHMHNIYNKILLCFIRNCIEYKTLILKSICCSE